MTLDGFSRVMHNRFNQDIPAAINVKEGEALGATPYGITK
jgi:hypothetical protein